MPNKKIPNTLAAILSDPKVFKEFEAYCKRTFCSENLTFIQVKSWKSENLYRIYFSKSSKTQVNLPSKIQAGLDDLATKKLWDDTRWDALVKAAKADITNLMVRDTVPAFRKEKTALAALAKIGYVL